MSSFGSKPDNFTMSGESKHFNMKQFILASKEYVKTRAEETANTINRHLQLISVTIDLSTFDPHTSVVAEFFVSLYELITIIEPRSPLAWCCVSVLMTACRNPSARKVLIKTYQFLPPLARLLGDHLILEKKIRLLTLLQELTCGIKISWQIPHLSHLISTLTKWIEIQKEDEVVTLSVGVLVNLCYKNLPAIYTLSKCVDLKQFIHVCMPLKGLKVEVHVCKLLLILDYMNGKVPDGALVKFTDLTFRSLREAFKARDPILMRHIVEFFLDVKQQSAHIDVLVSYSGYDGEIEELLDLAEGENKKNEGDCRDLDPECMSLVFEFIHSLLELRLIAMERLYPRLVNVGLKWIQSESVCSQALNTLRTIAINTHPDMTTVLEPLLKGVPMFLCALEIIDEMPTHNEHNRRTSALMQLLRALVQAGVTRARVLKAIKEDVMRKIFVPLLGDKSPRTRASEENTYSTEAVNLYVNALALVDELARQDLQWVNMHTQLLQQKQIHMVLAQALYTSSKEIKAIIFTLTSCPLFPAKQLAAAMDELQIMVDHNCTNSHINPINEDTCFPIMSIAQIERLDDVINKIKKICEENPQNMAMSDVMELYEYKMASMSHAERAAMANAEAASQRCTHLQHRTAQLTAELSRLHQLLFHAQQCHEQAAKAKAEIETNNKALSNRLEAEKGKLKVATSQLAVAERELADTKTSLEACQKSYQEAESGRQLLESQCDELKKLVTKLEENMTRKEKLAEKKEEALNRANINLDMYKLQVTQLERSLKDTEAELASRTLEMAEISKDLANKKQIMDTITKLANQQHQSFI